MSHTYLNSASVSQNTLQSNSSNGFAFVNGIKMYFEIHGKGMPLVLIHGGGSTIHTSFGNLLPFLSSHFKLIAIELQAHGHTNDRDSPESFEQDADDVAALLKYLNIDKAHILGFSNGGNTAMQLSMRHSKLVDKLVIISAFYKREGMIPGFFDGMNSATLDNMPSLLKEYYLRIPGNNQEGLLKMFNQDRGRMLHFKDWPDEQLQTIQSPALVIAGDHDVVTTAHTMKMSQAIPNAKLLILPGTHGSFIGEICSMEKESRMPEMVANLISDFLIK